MGENCLRLCEANFVLALVTSLLIATSPEASPRALGFVELLQEVRTNSKLLAQARAGVAIADGEVQKAWTAWQPRINAVGSVTLNSQEAVFDLNQLIAVIGGGFTQAVQDQLGVTLNPMFPQIETQVIQPHVQLAGVLSLNQTLFNITALRAPFVAKEGKKAAVDNVEALEDQLLFQGATLYATLLGLKGFEAAAERATKVASQRIDEARVQVEAGTATRLVITRAEADKLTAETQRTTVLAQSQKLRAALGLLIGSEVPVDVAGEAVAPAIDPSREYRDRTSIKAKAQAQKAAEAAIGLWSLAWLPSLTAEGQLRWLNFTGFSPDPYQAIATFNLVLPIYDQGVRYAETNLAEARAAAAKSAHEQAELEALLFLEEARADLGAAQAELLQAEAQLKLANESVAQAETLVKNGLATNLDLTDADSRRFSADRNAAQKKLALDLAMLKLHYATGGRLADLLPKSAEDRQ